MDDEHSASKPNAGTPAPAEQPSTPTHDLALIRGVTSDGQGLNIVRLRDGELSAGAVRPLVPGKPIQGEVLKLTPRKELPALCDVEVAYSPEQRPAQEASRKGPAQVATESYRKNWDAIWSKPEDKSLMN